jgi:hypothetical protein
MGYGQAAGQRHVKAREIRFRGRSAREAPWSAGACSRFGAPGGAPLAGSALPATKAAASQPHSIAMHATLTGPRGKGKDYASHRTLRPALNGQILPAWLLAARPLLEFLNGKNVFSFQLLRCFFRGNTISYFVRLTNIDIHKIFLRNEAVMYKKTSNISIFSCITKP